MVYLFMAPVYFFSPFLLHCSWSTGVPDSVHSLVCPDEQTKPKVEPSACCWWANFLASAFIFFVPVFFRFSKSLFIEISTDTFQSKWTPSYLNFIIFWQFLIFYDWKETRLPNGRVRTWMIATAAYWCFRGNVVQYLLLLYVLEGGGVWCSLNFRSGGGIICSPQAFNGSALCNDDSFDAKDGFNPVLSHAQALATLTTETELLAREAGTRILPKITTTMKMSGGPSIDLCSFG